MSSIDDDGVLWCYPGNDDDVTVYEPDDDGDVMVTVGREFRQLPPRKALQMAKVLKMVAEEGIEIRARKEAERRTREPRGPVYSTNAAVGPATIVPPSLWRDNP